MENSKQKRKEGRKSDLYGSISSFLAFSAKPVPLVYFLLSFSTCVIGQTVQTAIVIFSDWASQEISVYDGGEFVEVEWTVGPVPIDDDKGKEIILRYDTNIASQAKFYTDANGREVLQRTRDFRPTWNYNVTEPVSGNYYPVNSRIYIKDDTRQLTVLTGKIMIDRFNSLKHLIDDFDRQMR
jgi:lysosomal alpha-mannosidase